MVLESLNIADIPALKESSDKVLRTESEAGVILLAEDDVSSSRLIEILLHSAGYEVITAFDGTRALELAKQGNPDLILLDWMMPGMDGVEVCRYLRDTDSFRDVPIIFLTAKTGSRNMAKGFEAGGSDYISKPVGRTELLARIKTHLKLARSCRQLHHQAEQLERMVSTQSGRLNQVKSGQKNLLADPADFPEIKLAAKLIPAFEAGGDFYDIVRLSDDEYGFFIADIAGHDLGSTYLTGALKALTVSFTNEMLTVSESFLMFNNALMKFLSVAQYITACYVKYSRSKKTVDIITAAHPSPLIQRSDGETQYLEMTGDVLGMFDTITCESGTINVNPGDRLFLYTDGLIEGYHDSAGKTGDRTVGSACLADRINAEADLPIKDVVNAVMDDFLDECDGVLEDDAALLGIEF